MIMRRTPIHPGHEHHASLKSVPPCRRCSQLHCQRISTPVRILGPRRLVATNHALTGHLMTHSLFAVVVGIAHLSVVAHAAGQAAPTSQGLPPGRGHHVLFYDEARQRVMLTGGAANDARRNVIMFDDLWSFDGSAWTSLVASDGAGCGSRISAEGRNRIHAIGGYR